MEQEDQGGKEHLQQATAPDEHTELRTTSISTK